MSHCFQQTKSSQKDIASHLRALGSFYYWANEGNLGDLLIAESTRLFFEKEGLNWKPYHPDTPPAEESYNLVYGGGGRFTNHWRGLEKHQVHLTAPQVKGCVILPHSFYKVDTLLATFDRRHTIYCRGESTFNYVCATVSADVTVHLADDMAISMQLGNLPRFGSSHPLSASEEQELAHLLRLKVGQIMKRKVWYATVQGSMHGKRRKIAFLLRTDKEKSALISNPLAYDISLVWSSSCTGNKYTPELIHLFAEALQHPDIIVTDRLHVGIMAMHCGKEVYLIDNDYKKLSDVYNLSLKDTPTVHLLCSSQLPQGIQAAFHRLSHGWFSRVYLSARKLFKP